MRTNCILGEIYSNKVAERFSVENVRISYLEDNWNKLRDTLYDNGVSFEVLGDKDRKKIISPRKLRT